MDTHKMGLTRINTTGKRNCFHVLSTWVHSECVGGVRVVHLISLIFVGVLFVLFVLVMCLVPNVARVSDLSFLFNLTLMCCNVAR